MWLPEIIYKPYPYVLGLLGLSFLVTSSTLLGNVSGLILAVVCGLVIKMRWK